MASSQSFMVKPSSCALLLAIFAGGGQTWAFAMEGPQASAESDQRDRPFDRARYFDPQTPTSDDLRRVPIAQAKTCPANRLIVVNARVFDGRRGDAHAASVIVEGQAIASIVSSGQAPTLSGAEVIDARGATLIPGLIDLHTHLTYVFEFGSPPELSSESQADAALRGAERLRYYLESGITSVRDVGSHGLAPFILKRWVAEERIPGPRIFAAGQLIVGEGGHGTEGSLWRTAPGYPDAVVREASGADDWRSAVRTQFKRGADLIKLASHYEESELRAAVEEAHRLGLRVTVDSETVFTDMAARAGVDSIEHPLPRSEETVKTMAARGIASVPTIVPYQYILNEQGGYFGSTSRRFTLTETGMFDLVKKMRQAGVKLGVGTDLILDWYRRLPEPYLQELRNFIQVGYTPAQALVAATRTNAEILGMADRLGTLEPGKLADMVLIDGTPDRNIDDLRKVLLVIVNGRVLIRDGRLFVPRHLPAEIQRRDVDSQSCASHTSDPR